MSEPYSGQIISLEQVKNLCYNIVGAVTIRWDSYVDRTSSTSPLSNLTTWNANLASTDLGLGKYQRKIKITTQSITDILNIVARYLSKIRKTYYYTNYGKTTVKERYDYYHNYSYDKKSFNVFGWDTWGIAIYSTENAEMTNSMYNYAVNPNNFITYNTHPIYKNTQIDAPHISIFLDKLKLKFIQQAEIYRGQQIYKWTCHSSCHDRCYCYSRSRR